MKPKLKEIDLSKGEKGQHPDLKPNTFYLAKIEGHWYAGKFCKLWYGWNFYAVYSAGYQLSYGNTPEEDGWEELYEII